MTGIPYGFCHCGCGERASLADKTYSRRGVRKGEPNRYIIGHQSRKSPLEYIVDPATGCWEWQRGRSDGYGGLYIGGVRHVAHRVYWERVNGPVPAGLELDHVCRNRGCVNPDHLEAVTHTENVRRGPVRLSLPKAAAIRDLKRTGLTQQEIAVRFGVSKSAVKHVLRGRHWREDAA